MKAPQALAVSLASNASIEFPKARVFEVDGVPNIGCYAPYDLTQLILTYFGGTITHPGAVEAALLFNNHLLLRVRVKLGT